jgi:MoCo/4Fe-4S cofactor protein with predicted Tat translocation signal
MSKQDNNTKVWVNVEDLTQDPEFLKAQQNEFPEFNDDEQNDGPSRRDFLKYVGFGLGAATLASCEIPVKKAIPYVVKPEEIVPGVATYYASTFAKGGDVVPVLVKTREGRPIKIEGHPMAFTQGGTSARSQASVLDLYDTNRVKGPGKVVEGALQQMSWADLDKEVKGKLGSKVAIVSHTTTSPTLLSAIEQFKSKYNATHVQYDPFSASALLEANKAMYGKAGIPNYSFDKAKCIVGIDCDFLGTWVSPVEYSADYIKNRKHNFSMEEFAKNSAVADKVANDMSVHVQFEGGMSLTGSNADHRVLLKPSEYAAAVKMLFNEVASLTGNGGAGGGAKFAWSKAEKAIKNTAKKLVAAKDKGALVVCGVNDVNIQKAVNGINEMLGAYGKTISWDGHSKQRAGNDNAIKNFVGAMSSYDAVIIMDANPAYDLPGMAADFAKGLEALTKAGKATVSFNASIDETAALCGYVAPDHNYLETWGDVNPKQGEYYLMQPTIKPLFDTRAAGLSLLTWAGAAPKGEQPYYEYLKAFWKENLFTKQSKYMTVQAFWDNVLHDGMFKLDNPADEPVIAALSMEEEVPAVEEGGDDAEVNVIPVPTPDNNEEGEDEVVEEETTANAGALDQARSAANALGGGKSADYEVVFYETVGMGSGQYANNPWLQEMPDPVMRTTWDNFISIPVSSQDNNYTTPFGNLKDGDIAEVTIGGNTYQLPVVRQFGQHSNVVAIALGYGRSNAGKAGTKVGKNLFPEVKNFNYYAAVESNPTKVGRDSMFACVQMHHTYGLTTTNEDGSVKMDKSTGKPFNVDEYILGHKGFQGSLTNRSVFFESSAKDLKSGLETLHKKREDYQYLNSKGLYPDRKEVYGMGHWWAMSIDLNACTGCGACTVACMAENNVPVVGKFEVSKAHEMTWLRIDRYYYGNEETPNTAYMPMMCQHCENAPCENVCPVAATNHSSEGLNQMTYNRCIGTRYCANNCPYKVRRFNWLDYTSADLFPSNEVNMNRGMENDEWYTYMTDNLTRMVLNPDVTVRSRGVIEKCSFCVQRLQEAKLTAKVEGRRLKDGDVKVACQSACPTGAIQFGDRNDQKSVVTKWMESARGYLALEEVNVRSSVTYLMKVTNKDDKFTA